MSNMCQTGSQLFNASSTIAQSPARRKAFPLWLEHKKSCPVCGYAFQAGLAVSGAVVLREAQRAQEDK